MNLWRCDHPGCDSTVVGQGSALGLRAIGWYFKAGTAGVRPGDWLPSMLEPSICLCPRHRPDPVPCRADGNERDPNYGKPCEQCAGESEARTLQKGIAASLGAIACGIRPEELDR